MRKARTWKCQRTKAKIKCGQVNPRMKRKCIKCGGARPVAKKPAHMAALDETYEAYIALNGGNICAICKRRPSTNRRLDRDHDHKTGLPRGLLCNRCNRALPNWMTAAWLRKAALYLERGSNERHREDSAGSVPGLAEE